MTPAWTPPHPSPGIGGYREEQSMVATQPVAGKVSSIHLPSLVSKFSSSQAGAPFTFLAATTCPHAHPRSQAWARVWGFRCVKVAVTDTLAYPAQLSGDRHVPPHTRAHSPALQPRQSITSSSLEQCRGCQGHWLEAPANCSPCQPQASPTVPCNAACPLVLRE